MLFVTQDDTSKQFWIAKQFFIPLPPHSEEAVSFILQGPLIYNFQHFSCIVFLCHKTLSVCSCTVLSVTVGVWGLEQITDSFNPPSSTPTCYSYIQQYTSPFKAPPDQNIGPNKHYHTMSNVIEHMTQH